MELLSYVNTTKGTLTTSKSISGPDVQKETLELTQI